MPPKAAPVVPFEPSPVDARPASQGPDQYLLKPAEAADLLKVPITWVYSHQAEIPGYLRLGRYVRFRKSVLISFLVGAGVAC